MKLTFTEWLIYAPIEEKIGKVTGFLIDLFCLFCFEAVIMLNCWRGLAF